MPAAAPTLLAGMLSVASVLSVAGEAIQTSTPVLLTNEVTRPRMPVRSESCCAIRNTDTTTPMSVPRLFTGASSSMRSARPVSIGALEPLRGLSAGSGVEPSGWTIRAILDIMARIRRGPRRAIHSAARFDQNRTRLGGLSRKESDVGAKAGRPDNRRVQRTRRTLREALVALILERGWDRFSIQDICERADVGRSTFYTHFADKEDVVGAGFEDLGRGVRAELAAASGARRPLAFSRPCSSTRARTSGCSAPSSASSAGTWSSAGSATW